MNYSILISLCKWICLQLESSIDELMNTLECPICLDTADKPPIFQCPEGHLICESCSQHLDACPQCGHALMNSRNRTAEELASKLQVCFQYLSICPRSYIKRICKITCTLRLYFSTCRCYVQDALTAKISHNHHRIYP